MRLSAAAPVTPGAPTSGESSLRDSPKLPSPPEQGKKGETGKKRRRGYGKPKTQAHITPASSICNGFSPAMSSSSSKSPPTEWTDFLHCRLDTLTLGREPDPRHRPSRDGINNHQFHHNHQLQRPHTTTQPTIPVPPAAAAGPPVDQTWQPS